MKRQILFLLLSLLITSCSIPNNKLLIQREGNGYFFYKSTWNDTLKIPVYDYVKYPIQWIEDDQENSLYILDGLMYIYKINEFGQIDIKIVQKGQTSYNYGTNEILLTESHLCWYNGLYINIYDKDLRKVAAYTDSLNVYKHIDDCEREYHYYIDSVRYDPPNHLSMYLNLCKLKQHLRTIELPKYDN